MEIRIRIIEFRFLVDDPSKAYGKIIWNWHTVPLRCMQDEIFGPVVCVTSFKDEEEVINRVNNTRPVALQYI